MSETQRFDDSGTPAHWRSAVRVDRSGKLAKAERTASGGVRVEGSVAPVGIFTYRRADGTTVRELFPPEEAARLESLRSLRDAPVTIGHPMGMTGGRMVTPDTYRADAVGHVSGDPRTDGKHVLADLAILDGDAIRRIDSGDLVELSPGYALMIDPTPGVWNGQRYDAVQRMRVYNHVALLPAGAARGGTEASLRIDGVDDFAIELRSDEGAIPTTPAALPALTTTRQDSMKTERIDGIDYVVGSAEWQQAHARRMTRLDEEKAALEEKVEKQDEDLEALKTERDELKAKLEDIEKRLGDAESPERMDARVAERTALLDTARGVLGADAKFVRQDGKAMSDREVRAAVLAKLDPELKVDGQSDDVVRIHFDAAVRFLTKGAPAPAPSATSSPSPLGAARAAAVPAPGAPQPKRLDARDFAPDLGSKWRR